MATLTVTIDPAVIEAAEREAERRQMTLDAFIAESLSNIPAHTPADDFGHAELVELMACSPGTDRQAAHPRRNLRRAHMAAFLDTNILLYAFAAASEEDAPKASIAIELIGRLTLTSRFIVSAQVLGEFSANAAKKGKLVFRPREVEEIVEALQADRHPHRRLPRPARPRPRPAKPPQLLGRPHRRSRPPLRRRHPLHRRHAPRHPLRPPRAPQPLRLTR